MSEYYRTFPWPVYLVELGMTDPRGELLDNYLIRLRVRQIFFFDRDVFFSLAAGPLRELLSAYTMSPDGNRKTLPGANNEGKDND